MQYRVERRIIPTIGGKKVAVGDIVDSAQIGSYRAERYYVENGYLAVHSGHDPEMETAAAATRMKRNRGRPRRKGR